MGFVLALRFARVSVFALLIAFGVCGTAFADPVAVRAGARGDGARLVFEWPNAVGFTSAQTGNKILLRFDRPMEADVASLSSRLGAWVRSARMIDGGRVLELTLARPASPRSFASGTRIVLDLTPQARAASTSPTPEANPATPAQTPARSANSAPAPANVRIGHHPTFERAVLELGGAATVSQAPNTLTVTARTPRRLTEAQLARLRLPQIDKVEQSVANGQLTLRFALKAGVTAKNFRVANGVGLDFLNPVVPKPEVTAAAEKPSAAAEPSPKPPVAPVVETAATSEPVAAEPDDSEPATHANDKPPVTATTPDLAEKPSPAAEATTPVASSDTPPSVAAPVTHSAPAVVQQDHSVQGSVAGSVSGPAVTAAPTVAHVETAVLPNDVLPPLDMHVAKDTPIAVFRRGSLLYVAVSGRNAPTNLATLVGSALAADSHAKLVPAQGGSVVRLQVGSARVSPIIEAVDTGWRIHFSDTDPVPVTDLPIEVQPDYALGPRVLMRTDKAGPPVTFVDPVVGDTLIAVPVSPVRLGISHGEMMAQAELLPTSQGVAVRPLADALSVLSSSAGIEIGASNGLLLAEKLFADLPENKTPQAAATPSSSTTPVLQPLLDFASLGKPAGDQFIAQRQELQKAITEAKDEERDLRRIDLARFYFINGMPSEAAAIWSMVSASKPEYADRPEAALYRAIASFSAGTLDEIQAKVAALTQPTTDSALWRAMLAVRQRDWPTASENFRQAMGRIGDYPDPYRTRLELGLIETALQTQDYVMAEGAIRHLGDRQRTETHRLSPAVEYMSGALNWQQDKLDDARARFGSAAASRNQLWHVRAELALIEADLKQNKIDTPEAIKRLERLRFAWRGDSLEYDIVYRLAGLRLQNGDFASAFDDYSKLAERFPNDPRTPGLAEEQRTAFTRIFEGDTRDKTPTFSQLAIWDRYPQFRPTDEMKQDDIKLYLAERAAGIDLLDRSAGFISDVLAKVEEPVARAKMGAQLAGIYLLDGKPQEALKALSDSDAATTADQPSPLPEVMRDERRILQARALFGQNKPDDALALLANDYTDPATRLRADITWQTKRWAESAAALDALIGVPPAEGQKLAEGLAPLIVNRATALVLAGDAEGLTDLRVKFGAAMAETPQASAFQLLTRPDNAGGIESKLSVMRRVSEVDLFKQFLERYRGQAAATAGAPPATANMTPPSTPEGHDAAAH